MANCLIGFRPFRYAFLVKNLLQNLIRPVLVAGALAVALVAVVLPGSAGSAAPTTASIPISFGEMVVNGTTVSFPTVPGATLSGEYDADTGAFSGNLVVPAFAVSGVTSISTNFTLLFEPVNSPVTGTIPQSGTGSVDIGGWRVGILLPDSSITIESLCSVAIGTTSMTTSLNSADKSLLLAGPLSIPGATCSGIEPVSIPAGAGSESIVNSLLALPTSNASYALGSNDASALLAPARPTFTG